MHSQTTTCSIEGCAKHAIARGWCTMHYHRWRNLGDPVKQYRTDADRFWAKVEKTESCWLWRGAINRYGYGVFTLNAKYLMAHHFLMGKPPEGLEYDHICGVRNCIRPDHGRFVTPQINTLRNGGPSAANARKTHCPKGHEYTAGNTYVNQSTGRRTCRTCRDAWKPRSQGNDPVVADSIPAAPA